MTVAFPPDERVLLLKVSRGDKVAFRQLYEQVSPLLYAVALRLLKRREAAEEVVQQPAVMRDLAVLVDAQNVPTWIVRQQDQQLLLSSLTAQQIPSDRDLELWTIQGDQAPKSLGVIPVRDGQAIIGNIADTLLSADSVLAISIEPKNGSPTGSPTGAVLFTGKIRA